MSPVLSVPGTRRSPAPRVAFEWWWLLATGVAVVVLLALLPALHTSRFVSRVDVANSSDYAVDLEVAAPHSDGWMPLGRALNTESTSFREVFDVGATWVVRWEAQGVSTETVLRRADLARAGWKLSVPEDLVARLRVAHAWPTPKVANG